MILCETGIFRQSLIYDLIQIHKRFNRTLFIRTAKQHANRHSNIFRSTGHENNIAQPKANTGVRSTSHLSPFDSCLSVDLKLENGD